MKPEQERDWRQAVAALQVQVFNLAGRVNVLEECLEAVHQRLHVYFEFCERLGRKPTAVGLGDALQDVVQHLRCDLPVRIDQGNDVADG